MKKRLKQNKQKKSVALEVLAELPSIDILEETKTYEQLCKDARTSIERTAEDWIPRFCNALKRQHPLMKYTEIKNKVIDDWSRLWKQSTIVHYWPDWMKNPQNVSAGIMGGKATAAKTKAKKSDATKCSETEQQQQQTPKPATDTSQQQKPEISQATKAEQKHDTLVDDVLSLSMDLAEILTGYRDYDILRLDDNLALIEKTKEYRFTLTKRLDELNLKTVYKYSRRTAMILNDFLKQLDTELDSRHKKQSLTSE